MKALILALLPLTSFAAAGNDGPSAMPPAPSPRPSTYVVAQLTRACGFMCPRGDYSGLSIQRDGQVLYTVGDRDHIGAPALVATLGSEAMAKLVSIVDRIKAAELVDYDASRPACMDGPTETYQVGRPDGTQTKVEQDYGCHRHGLADHTNDDIKTVLDGLDTIAR